MMVISSIGKSIKPGFVRKGIKGKFLHGTIKKFDNKKGMVKKVIRR